MLDIEAMAREVGMTPSAWIVKAQYPFATMDPPIEGGLPRTELFTSDDLERFAQAVARRCAEICEATTEYGPPDLYGETPAYASAAFIRAEFGLKEEP